MWSAYVKLIPNPAWLAIVDRVLAREPAARNTMWVQAGFFVERMAKLPIGPFTRDQEARRDIALKVLTKLEANQHAFLAAWRARHHEGRNASGWWTMVQMLARSAGIDFARVSRQNTAPRGSDYAWVEQKLMSPHDLALLQECTTGPSG
jgi:hypothetical protein